MLALISSSILLLLLCSVHHVQYALYRLVSFTFTGFNSSPSNKVLHCPTIFSWLCETKARVRQNIFGYINMYNYNLVHIFETVSNGYAVNVLDLITSTSIIVTILVIISKNPIVSVLFLIGLFFNIACYLILLGLNFVGLSYLLVYVGAVSILFLFILMLINVRVSELVTENTNSIPLVLIIAIFFSFSAKQVLPINSLDTFIGNTLAKTTSRLPTDNLTNSLDESAYNLVNNALYVTSKLWDGNIAETTHIASIGNVMYSNYSIWLIITSIILLLAMVGTIVITIKKTTNY